MKNTCFGGLKKVKPDSKQQAEYDAGVKLAREGNPLIIGATDEMARGYHEANDRRDGLLRRVVIALGIIVSIAIGFGSGCRLGTPDFPPATQSTNVARPFAPGLTITFPNQPTEGVINLLAECPARKVSEKVYVIQVYNENNPNHRYALQQAQRERAVLTGWMYTP